MLDLVGDPEDWFSCVAAQLFFYNFQVVDYSYRTSRKYRIGFVDLSRLLIARKIKLVY